MRRPTQACRCRIFHVLTGLWILLSGYIAAQTVNVPLSHWVYDVLERWETRGYIDNVYDHTRPYTRTETAEYIAQVLERYRQQPERFTGFDRQYLEYCAEEFAEELQALKAPLPKRTDVNRFRRLRRVPPLSYILPGFVYHNNRNFLSRTWGEFSIFLDPVLHYSQYQSLTAEGTLTRTTRMSNGLLFRGSLGSKVGFYFNLTDNHVTRNVKFPVLEIFEESGWPWLTNRTGESIDFDENAAYLMVTHKYFSLQFGRDYNRWGGGHTGQLVLSTNAPIYDQIKLTVRYWRFKFTHITAFVNYIAPEARRSVKLIDPVDVYWAGNRLEVYLGRGVQLGVSESIIYGNQSLKPGYMNPLAFFKSLEHFYGDRDNGALSFDLAWRIRPGIKIFGEWFIDDITTTRLGTRWFGNKFGWQGGLLLVDPFRLPGTDVLVEYTRIKPYVYSHTFRDYNKYKHVDTILGHYIGPNSDDWYVRLRHFFHRRLRVQLELEAYRHGSNPPDRNVGGDPDRPHRAGDADEVIFLDGIRVKRTAFGGEVRYELLRNTFLVARLHRITGAERAYTAFALRIGYNFGHREEVLRPFEVARE